MRLSLCPRLCISANVHVLGNCINRIFGACDKSSLEHMKLCFNLNSMVQLIDRKRTKFIDFFDVLCAFYGFFLPIYF